MCSVDQFEALFVEYRPRLHRHARQLLGSHAAEADDVVHNAYLKGHAYLRAGNSMDVPYNFLCMTVRNLTNDGFRRKKIRRADSTIDVGDVAPGSEVSSVERQVMSQRKFYELCVAIEQLPDRMRVAFVLRKVYGYSCREIAKYLGTSVETVRKQVAEAFKRLRGRLIYEEKPKRVTGCTREPSRLLRVVPSRKHE